MISGKKGKKKKKKNGFYVFGLNIIVYMVVPFIKMNKLVKEQVRN